TTSAPPPPTNTPPLPNSSPRNGSSSVPWPPTATSSTPISPRSPSTRPTPSAPSPKPGSTPSTTPPSNTPSVPKIATTASSTGHSKPSGSPKKPRPKLSIRTRFIKPLSNPKSLISNGLSLASRLGDHSRVKQSRTAQSRRA